MRTEFTFRPVPALLLIRIHEEDLLADPKELAEHIMLVDLGRNDLGRVCAAGSVQVDELMVIERYSHVMHIASNVEGKLKPGLDAIAVLKACFPAEHRLRENLPYRNRTCKVTDERAVFGTASVAIPGVAGTQSVTLHVLHGFKRRAHCFFFT